MNAPSYEQQQAHRAAENHAGAVALISPGVRPGPKKGSIRDRDAAPTEGRRRSGIFAAELGSAHMLTIDGARAQLEVYSANLNEHAAKGAKVVCLHPKCLGATFATEAELVKGHASAETLARAEEGHAFALLGSFKGEGTSTPCLLIREQE